MIVATRLYYNTHRATDRGCPTPEGSPAEGGRAHLRSGAAEPERATWRSCRTTESRNDAKRKSFQRYTVPYVYIIIYDYLVLK